MTFQDGIDDGYKPVETIIHVSNPNTLVGKPIKGCPICKGTGYLPGPNHTTLHCECTIKDFGIQYLTPALANAPFDKTLNPAHYDGRDLYFYGDGSVWKQVLKSYLLKKAMQLSFAITAPRHILTAKLSRTETPEHNQALVFPHLLVVHFAFDPPNGFYGGYIASVIQDRQNLGKATWLVASNAFTDEPFRKAYDPQGMLTPLLRETFTAVNIAAPK